MPSGDHYSDRMRRLLALSLFVSLALPACSDSKPAAPLTPSAPAPSVAKAEPASLPSEPPPSLPVPTAPVPTAPAPTPPAPSAPAPTPAKPGKKGEEAKPKAEASKPQPEKAEVKPAPAPTPAAKAVDAENTNQAEGPVKFLDDKSKAEHEGVLDDMMGDSKAKSKALKDKKK